MKYCPNCKKIRKTDNFFIREDRMGYYAFCKDCMASKGRSPDLPLISERGDGLIFMFITE